jgi:hypothetical protein
MRLRAGVPALRNELRWAWRRIAFSWRSSLRGTLEAVSGRFEAQGGHEVLYGRLLRSRGDAVAGARHGGGGVVVLVVVDVRVAEALFVNMACRVAGGAEAPAELASALATPHLLVAPHLPHRHTACTATPFCAPCTATPRSSHQHAVKPLSSHAYSKAARQQSLT